MTRPCPSCGAPVGEHCRFGPHANLKNPRLSACAARALPRDRDAESAVVNRLAVETLSEMKRARADVVCGDKRLAELAQMLHEIQETDQ